MKTPFKLSLFLGKSLKIINIVYPDKLLKPTCVALTAAYRTAIRKIKRPRIGRFVETAPFEKNKILNSNKTFKK